MGTALGRLTFRLSAFAAAAVLSGCSFLFGTSADLDPARFSTVTADERAAILDEITEPSGSIRTGRLLYRTTMRRYVASESVRQAVVFEYPSKLRIELFASGFNKLIALLIANEGQMYMLDPSTSRAYLGTVSSDSIERLLSFPFLPDELVSWSLGALPQRVNAEIRQDSAGAVLATFEPDAGRRVAALFERSGSGLRLTELEITEPRSGELVFRSRSEYHESFSIPARIEIELPRRDARGELVLERFVPNPDLGQIADRLFRIEPPAGVRLYDLDSAIQAEADDAPPTTTD